MSFGECNFAFWKTHKYIPFTSRSGIKLRWSEILREFLVCRIPVATDPRNATDFYPQAKPRTLHRVKYSYVVFIYRRRGSVFSFRFHFPFPFSVFTFRQSQEGKFLHASVTSVKSFSEDLYEHINFSNLFKRLLVAWPHLIELCRNYAGEKPRCYL